MRRLFLLCAGLLLVLLPLVGQQFDNHQGQAFASAVNAPATAGHAVDTHAAAAGAAGEGHGEVHAGGLGASLPLWSTIPFVGILLSIALFPLLAPHFWHHHFGKIAAFWAVLFVVPFTFAFGFHQSLHAVLHIYVLDYIPFIILLAALFVIAGGIAIKGSFSGTPIVNTAILLIGTILSSWIGTTGSSMLLIRPLLKSNSHRKNRAHLVIFFIFLVSNIGGALTPIGDPPLFLGFLHGVDFFWTLKTLPMMTFNVVVLLVIFFALDRYLLNKEHMPEKELEAEASPVRLEGAHNFLLLGGVVGAVILSGVYNSDPLFYDEAHHMAKGITLMGGDHPLVWPFINMLRDGFLILLLLLSLKTTREETHQANDFNWFPIQEVAFLFAGIFMTIIPALEILKAGTSGAMGFIVEKVSTDASYFWVTGLLSSFLDNAPTYLTFFNTALGSFYPGMTEAQAVPLLMQHGGTLLAISCGAVFMGANTYIGNAPNFMVKSIAEQGGVKMPSFFGYMGWSLVFLIPLFVVNTFLFF
jgi:Na+/H+ antiporter NhaD/arsenite permease-like protein